MTVTMFGIPNCDTVKKARAWLNEQGVAYDFHDYKKAGADAGKLAAWIEKFGWEKVLNRAGTTFKKLPEDMKADLDGVKAIAIMIENPSAIKRPIVEYDGGALLGFNAAEWKISL
jgi:Spx/MgsR family transcriptional regulator